MSKSKSTESDLSPVELEIMKLVWNHGRVRARQVCDGIEKLRRESGAKPLKFSTVSTYLERLRLKKIIDREQNDERQFEYFALVPKEHIQDQMLRKLEGLFESGGDMLHRFASIDGLTKRERKEFSELARRLKEDKARKK